MMQQNKETQTNSSGSNKASDLEKSQAHTGSEVREGQEDSSILEDKNSGKEKYPNIEEDKSSSSQEEYIDNDKNTTRQDDAR